MIDALLALLALAALACLVPLHAALYVWLRSKGHDIEY